jgi:uncharacterized LabA/DUF88 family protein
MKKNNKIAIFIDEENVWSSYKSIGKFFKYSAFKRFFEKKFSGNVYKIFFYKAYPKNDTRSYDLNSQHKFMTYLKKGLGFYIKKKELKIIFLTDNKGNFVYDKETGKQKTFEKGNFDVEITIDAMRYINEYDMAIFFSGDSDFLPLIKFLRHSGKKVFIFSTKNSISTELRTGANGYFDIKEFPEIHGNNLQHRNKNQPDHNEQAA